MNMLFNLATSVMNFLGSPAGMVAANAWDKYKDDAKYGWLYSVCEMLNNLLTPILILVGTAGLIYAVVLGVNLARADSADKQQEAKKRLVYAIIGLAVIILLIILLRIFMNNVDSLVKIEPTT